MDRKKLWDEAEMLSREAIPPCGKSNGLEYAIAEYECSVCETGKRELRMLDDTGPICERCCFTAKECIMPGCDGISINGILCRACFFDYEMDAKMARDEIFESLVPSTNSTDDIRADQMAGPTLKDLEGMVADAYRRLSDEAANIPDKFGCKIKKRAS